MDTESPNVDSSLQLSVFVGSDHPSPAPENPLSPDFMDAFEKVTGWVLGFDECRERTARRKKPGMRATAPIGQLKIVDMSSHLEPDERPLHRKTCDFLVKQISDLIAMQQKTKLMLQAAQAELATQVPVVVHPADSEQLAELLAGLLDAAAKSLGLQNAALYLLDDNTEFLQLRASVGNAGCNAEQERLLTTCPADVEAMAGHAIVVSDSMQSRIWSTPASCESAVCVPVSSMNTILGSLWIMGDSPRQFTDAEVNIVEIVAGRVAAELERAALIRQSAPVARTDHSTGAREHLECHDQLAQPIDPPFAGWKFDGYVGQNVHRFIEWDVLADEQLEITVGRRDSGDSISCLIDPLTTDLKLEGESKRVQFWIYDSDNVLLQRVSESSPIRRLVSGQCLIASTTQDMQRVGNMIAARESRLGEDFILALHRR